MNPESQVEAKKLLQEGTQLLENMEFEHAQTCLSAALLIARRHSDTPTETEGWILKHLSFLAINRDEYEQAEALIRSALEVARAISEPILLSNTLNMLGRTLFMQEQYQDAVRAYQEARSYLNADSLEHWKVLANLGETYYWMEAYEPAIHAHQQALQYAKAESSPIKIATSLYQLAQVYWWSDHLDNAIDYFKQSYRYDEDDASKLTTLKSLGIAYSGGQRWPQAIETFQAAIELSEKINAIAERLALLKLMAVAQLSHQDFTGASQSALTLLDLAKSHPQPELEAEVWHLYASAQTQLSNFDAAFDAAQTSLSLAQSNEDVELQAIAWAEIGNVYSRFGEYSHSISAFEQVLVLSANPTLIEASLKYLGQLYSDIGESRQAVAWFQKYLNVASQYDNGPGMIDAHLKIGDGYHRGGEFTLSTRHYQQAYKLADQSGDVNQAVSALVNLASAYRARLQYDQALNYAQHAAREFVHLTDPMTKAYALQELGGIELLTQDPHSIYVSIPIRLKPDKQGPFSIISAFFSGECAVLFWASRFGD